MSIIALDCIWNLLPIGGLTRMTNTRPKPSILPDKKSLIDFGNLTTTRASLDAALGISIVFGNSHDCYGNSAAPDNNWNGAVGHTYHACIPDVTLIIGGSKLQCGKPVSAG